MAKIYKTTDRIKLKIGGVTVSVAPLTFNQKNEIQLVMYDAAKNKDTMGILKAAFLCVKYAVKHIEGVEQADGSPYKLESENGSLTDDSVNDLFSLEESDNLSMVCINLLQSRYDNFINIETKEKLAGVEVITEGKLVPKKKKTSGL